MNWRQLDKKEQAEQFRFTLVTFPEAARFILKNRLWECFWRYGWFSRIFMFIAILIGISLISDIFSQLRHLRFESFSQSVSSMGMAVQGIAHSGYELITNSGSKFFMLVLLEVIVFHASRLTLQIISGKDSKASFDHFLKAQFRMIIVGGYAWVLTLVFSIPVKIAFGIFEFLDFLKPTALFLVQAFFMGFSINDNYTEQFKLEIGQSLNFSYRYPAITLAIGIVVSLLLWVPVAGPIIAPLLAAVTATLVLYQETPLHILGPAMIPTKKQKKKEKKARQQQEELVP